MENKETVNQTSIAEPSLKTRGVEAVRDWKALQNMRSVPPRLLSHLANNLIDLSLPGRDNRRVLFVKS